MARMRPDFGPLPSSSGQVTSFQPRPCPGCRHCLGPDCFTFHLVPEGPTHYARLVISSLMSAVIIRHCWNTILLRELFLLASVIRLVFVHLFRKHSGEAETSISEDASESGKEPGIPGPKKHLDGYRTVGRSEFPPQCPHPPSGGLQLQAVAGPASEPSVYPYLCC